MAEFKLGRLRFVWKDVWTTGTSYVKDDIVRYGGSTFVCIAAHTANADFDADLAGNKWQKMSAGFDFKNDPWTPSTVYKENDIVRYGGKLYIALSNHTSDELQDGGFYIDTPRWALLSDGQEWKGVWQTDFYYKLGDIIKYNSSTYICTTPHTSAATEELGLEEDAANWDLSGEGFKWKDVWTTGTRFIVNDVVKYGPNLWLCQSAHTSTNEFDNSNWTLFVSGLEFESTWSASTEYQEGDIVTYGGYSFISAEQHINQLPTNSPNTWKILVKGYNHRERYQVNQSYRVGDVINYGGKSFVAKLDVAPGESPYANPNKWDLVSDGIRWLGDWTDNNSEGTYKIGDAVRYQSSTFVCIDEHAPVDVDSAGVVNRPDTDINGVFWNALAEGDEQNVLTRRGDLVTRNAIQNQRLPKGIAGTFLKAGDIDLEWGKVGNITRVFYVSTDGIDGEGRGTTLDESWRTIKFACDYVRTQVVPTVDQPAVIMVKTGVYQEEFPISIPKFTSLVGDELRMSIVEPTEETSHLDKFYMRDSTTVRNFTFRGATGAPGTNGFTELNQYNTRRPTGGSWIGLDPGEGPNDESVWVGQRSPYVQNVTTFGDYCVGQKIDGALHNGGNKSITSNDFTQVMSDSIGAWCLNQGRAELVSVFTYYSYIGYLCESGGVIRATNGNNSYGTFGSISEGVDPTEISRTAEVDNRRLQAQVDRVQTNGNSLLYLEYLNAGEEYTTAEFTFGGPGSATLLTDATFSDGGVCEVRVLVDGDNYLNVVNNAQQGTDIDIRLSASDTTITNGYNGMRITIIDGNGAGQYGIVNNFDGGSKDAVILKESFPPLPIIETIGSSNTLRVTAIVGDYTIGPDQAIMLLGSGFGGLNTTQVYYVKTFTESGGVISLTLYTDTVTKDEINLIDAIPSESATIQRLGWDVFVKPRVTNITNITRTNPVRVTTDGNHGLISGFVATFSDIEGMTQLNGNSYYIIRINNTQFDLYTNFTLLFGLNGTGFTDYVSGGVVSGTQEPAPFLDTTTRYQIEPRPVFSTGEGATATAVRTLGIDELAIVDGGAGFTTAPRISLAGPDLVLGNSSAQGDVFIRGGVESVVIQSKGSGYTSPPTLAFVGGGLPASNIDWAAGIEVKVDDSIRTIDRNVYRVTIGGELGTTAPNHTSGSNSNGTATLQYLGRIASATASITSTIKTVSLVSGGVGYITPPSVVITGTGGQNAVISAQISQVIGEINVVNSGINYISSPTVTILGGEPLVVAQARAILNAELDSVTILEGGGGYNPNTIQITISGGGGAGAVVEAEIDFGGWIAGVTPGVITAINVIDSGSNYATPPSIIIENGVGGIGQGASAVANIKGTVDRIEITSRGRGYRTTPTVQITGGGGSGATATAVRTGSVSSLTVVDGGRGWQETPTLQFTGGGASEQAFATVTAMDTVIDEITIVDSGENYSSNPALAVRAGGGSGAILRPRIDGKVVAVNITDPGSDYSSNPIISFIGGGNYRSAVAGLRYYTNSLTLEAISIRQRTQTLASIERIKQVAQAVAANSDPVLTFQSSVGRTSASAGYVVPTNINPAIASWVNAVYYTIENEEQLKNASELLRINRLFLRTEIKAFLDNSFAGVPDDTWTRDIGLIIDAVEKDIDFRGVNNSLSCGISQAFLTARQNPNNFGNLGAITAAFEYMVFLFKNVVQNIVITPTLSAPLNWRGIWQPETVYAINDVVIVNDNTYISTENHTSAGQFTVDLGLSRWTVKIDGQRTNLKVFEPPALKAIENNLSLIENLIQFPAGGSAFIAAADLIKSNSTYIKSEVISFVNTTYQDFDYNQVLSARDVEFIIDALSYDLKNANGIAEPDVTASTTGVVARITVNNPGEGYSEGVQISISGGGSPTITATARPVIDQFTGEIVDFTMTNKGKGYSTDPITVTITPDTGFGAIARCRLAGTNVSKVVIIEPGQGYSAGPFLKLIDPNNTVEAQFQVRVADGVLGQPTWQNRGVNWLDAEANVEGDGFADISQTGSFIYVKSLTNVPTPGANIQFRGNEEFYKLVTVREVFGPDGIIGGRQLLLANKVFIQEEIISYLNNFQYTKATCERDIGFIIDALAEDVVYNSNYRILYSIQQYNRGTYAKFEDQRFQTAFAIQYLRDQIAQSQKPATLASLEELKSVLSTELSSNATAVTRAEANMDIIIDILDNGTEAAPAYNTPDPTGYNTGFFDARRLVELNREFITAEIIKYLDDNYSSLNYDLITYQKKINDIIDALKYDLTYGGNLMTLQAGLAYYSYGELQITGAEKTALLAAYDYLRSIVDDVILGQLITPLQLEVTQDTTGTAGSSDAAAFAQNRIQEIRTTINTGISPATITPDTGWVDTGILAARASMVSNKTAIQAAIINFIEVNFPTLVFNRATCSRDIGLIIDAVGWDVVFGSNFQSITAGSSYYRGSASNVLTGILGLSTLLNPLIEWIKNGEFFKPLPEPAMPDGNSTEPNDHNGKNIILANIEFIGAQGWRKFVNDNESVTIDEKIFRSEIEQLALTVAHSLTHASNIQVVDFARSFYTGATLTIPGYNGPGSEIKSAYLSLIDYLSSLVGDIVRNFTVVEEAGLPSGISQDRSLPAGTAGTTTKVTNLLADFRGVINLTPITIGDTVIIVNNTFTGYKGSLLSARQSLADSKTALKTATSNWIDDTFVNFTYNNAVCYRDVGLIVQAIADDVFGDVAKSIEAGQRYFAATAALVLSDQRPQTIAAIDRINIIAQRVIRNETYERTQNNAFQERFPSIVGGGDAGPALEDRIRIIRRILETGEVLDNVKQLLLENKEYIKAEVISYIDASYENLNYDQVLCARDVGLIVDALVYDIYGGFSRSREAGLRYYSSASALIAITTQKGPTVDGIERIRDLMLSIIQDQTPDVTFQETVNRVSPGQVYDLESISELGIDVKIAQSISEVIRIIEQGPEGLPSGLYRARLQVSPPITVFNTPSHLTPATIRSKYSQVRLTGHDFLNIGTGGKSDTNYPGIPVNVPDQGKEIREVGGGRVFYTSTDQDGNFRVGELFRVEQSTGIATLNADAFNLSGLNELSLGGITLGGTNAVVREFSTDPTFFANSDNIVPTQKAIKTYIQSALGSGGGNIAVNAVIAGQVFVSGDELTTIGNIPLRYTTTGGNFFTGNVDSDSPSTGTVIITEAGGLGVGGNVNIGGTLTATSFVTSPSGVQNTPIGTVTRNTGAFTTLTANNITTITSATQSDNATTGALVVSGGVGIGGNLNVNGNFNVGSLSSSGIDNTPIGSIGRASGAFTTLAANSSVTFTGNIASNSTSTGSLVVTGGVGISAALNIGSTLTVGSSVTANGSNASISLQPTGSGSVTINPAAVGNIDRMNIGSTTRGSGAFTSLTSNAATTFTAGTASSSTGTGTLVVTGGVGISGQLTAATIVETSSITFKENVNPIDNALDAILHLNGVLYDRKDGSAKNEAGLIAEEVNKYIPEIVTKDKDGNPYGIAYTKLTAYLVESIKSLKEEIDQLKGKK